MRRKIAFWSCVVWLGLSAGSVSSAQDVRNAGFVYVATDYAWNAPEGKVSAYAIDAPTGTLAPVAGSPFAPAWRSWSVAANTKGQFLYALVHGHPAYDFADGIAAYVIDLTTGALVKEVPGSPFQTEFFPGSLTVEPLGQFAYASSGGILPFTIDQATGALTALSKSLLPDGYEVTAMGADPAGQFLYVGACRPGRYDPCAGTPGVIFAYAIERITGELTPVSGSPFSSGYQPVSLTVDPTGRFVYVTNSGSGGIDSSNVRAYSIDQSTGALTETPGSPFLAGAFPLSVAVEPSGRFAYVADNSNQTATESKIWAYGIDQTSGALVPVAGSPFATGKGAMSATIDPSGHFVYVLNPDYPGEAQISGYSIEASTGALTPVPGSPFPVPHLPNRMVVTAGLP